MLIKIYKEKNSNINFNIMKKIVSHNNYNNK